MGSQLWVYTEFPSHYVFQHADAEADVFSNHRNHVIPKYWIVG